MELASKLRWILFISAGALILILILWGLFSIASNLFRGDSNSSVSQEVEYDIPSATTARFTTDGPVVANEDHRSYVIEVSDRVVSMKVYAQYGSRVIEAKSYPNTSEAFDTFLQALEAQDVSNRRKGTDLEDDNKEVGVCASGRRYIVEVGNDIRRWSTSCGSATGTAGFNMSRVRSLFQKQVPDYNELLRDVSL